MNELQPLVDLSPAAQLALMGAILALGPLAWTAWRLWHQGGVAALRDAQSWQRTLVWVTLFLTIDLVVFGAFTRLTDSGLGCPDWPGCYGQASPLGARTDISAAQAVAPHGPVTHGKAWIEMIHRYLATGVGALITLLMVLAWTRVSRQLDRARAWWATATFVWVCVQGAFGALTVTLKLYPLVVTVHLLGGLLGVALLSAQVARAGEGLVARLGVGLAPAQRRWAAVVLLLWLCQAVLGAWVSTNYAVLICADFPMCQGQWWPDMDWSMGFTMMRPLGGDGAGGSVTVQALTAIHMAHRLGAMVVVLAVSALAWQLQRAGAQSQSRVLWGLLALQVLSGLSNVVLGWPLLAALGHTLGAALMVAALTGLVARVGAPVPVAGARPMMSGQWVVDHG